MFILFLRTSPYGRLKSWTHGTSARSANSIHIASFMLRYMISSLAPANDGSELKLIQLLEKFGLRSLTLPQHISATPAAFYCVDSAAYFRVSLILLPLPLTLNPISNETTALA